MVQVTVKRMKQADAMKIPWKHCSVQGPPQGQQLSLCPQRPFQWIHRPLALPRRLSGKESACQFWETWIQSLGREDPLEEETAAHSSILTWRIPWILCLATKQQ